MSLDLSKLENVKRGSDKTTAACPACRSEGLDSAGNHLVLFHATGKFGCCVNQDDSHRQAIWRLAGDGTSSSTDSLYTPPEEQPQIELARTWDPAVLDRLVKDYSYWAGRGISEATIAHFRGGVATDGQMKDRWVIPIFNDDGLIIGFTGRALHDWMKPKWRNLGKVSSWVLGDLDEIESCGVAVLVESRGCLLSLREHGVPYVLDLFGVNISQAVVGALIAANPKRILVATNNDTKHNVGQTAAAKIATTLRKFFDEDIVEIALPTGKDFNEMDGPAIAAWKTAHGL